MAELVGKRENYKKLQIQRRKEALEAHLQVYSS